MGCLNGPPKVIISERRHLLEGGKQDGEQVDVALVQDRRCLYIDGLVLASNTKEKTILHT